MEGPGTAVVASVTALVVTVAAAAAWRHRDAPGGRYATVYLLAVAGWVGGVALETTATTLDGKLFWLNVQYPLVAVVPVAALGFVAAYLGYDDRITTRRLVALAVPLVVLTLLSWTNSVHGLVRVSSTVVTVGGESLLVRDPGPAWWVGWLYNQALILAAFLALAYGAWDSASPFRLQIGALLFGAGVPWLAQLPLLLGVSPVRTELLFGVTGLAFLAAIRWTRFFEVAPVGRARVIEALSDPVFVFDGRDRLVEANPAADDWVDHAVTGDPMEAVLGDFPSVEEAYRHGDSLDDPVELHVGDGRRHATVVVDSLPSVGNRRTGRVVVVRDVTRLKRREAELASANERLETMANAIAHDLRNPLSIARGYHELARAGDETAHERIETAHERMATIIDDTLASAIEEVPPEFDADPVRVESIARDAWGTVSTEAATLRVRGEGRVTANPGRLQGFFENLFHNSVEHADCDAVVTVAVTDSGFVVADNGPGIPESDRERVFEHGHSGDGGTGIGLAAVRETATDHGWALGLTEGADGGAAFVVATDGGSVATVAEASGIVTPDTSITVVTKTA